MHRHILVEMWISVPLILERSARVQRSDFRAATYLIGQFAPLLSSILDFDGALNRVIHWPEMSQT